MRILEQINREIIHYADAGLLISSKYRTIFIKRLGVESRVVLPEHGVFRKLMGTFRLGRRALRLDKCNVVPVGENLIIIRQGLVYFYDATTHSLQQTLALRNCRNVLHQSICVAPNGNIYFGEYGHNSERNSVPVYRSVDGGRSWQEIYTFGAGSIKHVHGCYYDRYTDRIWVCTGDFAGENIIMSADADMNDVQMIGDGSQRYRACNLIFTQTEIHWLMDSQLETSHHVIYNRESGVVEIGQALAGPVWYIKELTGGNYLASTAQEIGPGVLDGYAHVYHSTDLRHWKSVLQFAHDGLPKRYFKFGVIGFADGEQSPDAFYVFFEALKKYDGRSVKCTLN